MCYFFFTVYKVCFGIKSKHVKQVEELVVVIIQLKVLMKNITYNLTNIKRVFVGSGEMFSESSL